VENYIAVAGEVVMLPSRVDEVATNEHGDNDEGAVAAAAADCLVKDRV